MWLLSRHLRVVSVLSALWLTSFVWKGVEARVTTGQYPLTTNVSHPANTTASPLSTGPALGTFVLSMLRRRCIPAVIPTNVSEWDKIVQDITKRINMTEYSCNNHCGASVEERKSRSMSFTCYCDKFCEDFGDCCFDFDLLCRAHVIPETSNETCVAGLDRNHGHTVWNTCPQNLTATKRTVRQKCQDEDQSDVMANLPVFDKDRNVHYRNIFCARCNGAVNTQYWRLKLSCSYNNNVFPFKLGNVKILLPPNCLIDNVPLPYGLLFEPKRCAPRFQCSRPFEDKSNWISLVIFLDFSSTSKTTIEVTNGLTRKKIKEELSCRAHEVFDPFEGRCTKIEVSGSSKHNDSQAWNANCTVIAFHKTEYVQLHNGSVYVKPHNKMYNNASYTIRASRLLLCVNFSSNFSSEEKGEEKTPASLQILSSVGCIVSMVSLVLLLMTYILFAELRNLPGKIIINLTLSLLLYQSVFFSAVKNDDQDTCLAIAVLLHYFVLSSFTWMNVVAYDVHRTFTTSGGVAIRQNRQGRYTRRLVIYCLYAWGSPVLPVLSCVIADNVKEGSIAYGRGEEGCFISQPRAKLYSLVLPVALLLIFNLYALGHTAIHIIKTRKKKKKLTNQPHGSNIAVICFKMASVMGVTWILGIAANLKALAFLWYPYVVLNSLQGLFIFLSFAASGKALELYKRKLAGILKKSITNGEADKRRNRDGLSMSFATLMEAKMRKKRSCKYSGTLF